MKVCIITNIPSPYRVDFFNYLINNSNYDITVIYSSKNEDNRLWKIDKSLIRNSIFLKSKTIKIKKRMDNKYIHIPIDVIGKLNNIKPDVVIGSEYNPTILLAFIWCKMKKVKYISWSDGTLNSEKNINKIQLFLRKMICSNADSFIASSSATKLAQLKYGAREEKIFKSLITFNLDNYINYNYKKTLNKIPKIIFVGSLIKRKGVDLLFKALSLVKEKYILEVIGDGPEKEELAKLSKQLNIYNNIRFRGFLQQEELIKLYYESDIFILPTREDCYGLVLLEAMCCGLAIIASKHADGVIDIVEDGINGYIIDPYDIENMSNKIETLLEDTSLCRKMGIYSKEKIQNFSMEKVSKGFINSIDYVLN